MVTRQFIIKHVHTSIHQHFQKLQYSSTNYAHQLFDDIPQRNFHPINYYMLNYIRKNLNFRALNVFKTELHSNYPYGIDENTVAIAVKACHGDLKAGTMLHGFVLSSGYISFRGVENSVMSMYSKSGKFDDALRVFDSMYEPDVVSYNTVLMGFRNSDDALFFVGDMNANGVVFDTVTYVTSLSSCLDYRGFLLGSQLHCRIIRSGWDCELFIGNALITLYSRWGRIIDAERVFDWMPFKDLVSWNAILCGYSQDGSYGLKAIFTFCEMLRCNMKPDHISLTAAINACGSERVLMVGKMLHGLSIKVGYGIHSGICNMLMSTYSKCEVNEDVKLVFQDMDERNVISWTTMISVFPDHALFLFHQMRVSGVYPNDVTFLGLLHAITLGDLCNEGRMVHGFCLKIGFLSELNVCNSLVSMYAKFQLIRCSRKVFDELHYRDIVSWNALITGYDNNKLYQEALELFYSAIEENVPNQYTFGSVLSAIGSAESISLRHGQRCHSHLFKLGLQSNPIVSAALLDMYAKRGSLSESKRIFGELTKRTQFAWTAIISAHSRHGDYESVMKIFYEMINQCVRPDSITFLSMLTACGRKGMIDMGHQIWDSMIKDNLIEPSSEHYACMVDMLGRAGRLKEAEDLLSKIPGGPSFSALQSLLGSSREHGNMEIARRVANALIEMDPEESGSYVLMSNLYAEKGDWEKVAKMRRKMRDNRVRKEVGFSWVDVGIIDGSWSMHGFSSGDTSHPRSEEIYKIAGCLGLEIRSREKDRSKDSLLELY